MNRKMGKNKIFDPIIPSVPLEIMESPTGRYFLLFQEGEYPKNEGEVIEKIDLFSKISCREFNDKDLDKKEDEIFDTDVIYFKEFGFAITSLDINDFRILERKANVDFAIMPEEIHKVKIKSGRSKKDKKRTPSPSWNLSKVVKQTSSLVRLSNHIVNVALLDTGLYYNHDAFKNQRNNPSHSFISNNAEDDNGHGTHIAGIICGDGITNKNTILGIAPIVKLHICKVLDYQTKGKQTNIIFGIKWAVKHKCKIISLSASAKDSAHRGFDPRYERVLSWAKSKDTLVVASAGDDSHNRPKTIEPLASPANCPSAIAVTAINSFNKLYPISNGAKNTLNQCVSFTGPGENILSSWIKPYPWNTGFSHKSGSSFAVPHVTAVLALYKNRNPQKSMNDILQIAKNQAIKLPRIDDKDQGNGLIFLT